MQRPSLRSAFRALTCVALASWLPAACGGRSETGDFLHQSDAPADPDSGTGTSGERPETEDANEERDRPGDDRDEGQRDDPGEGDESDRGDGDDDPNEHDDDEEEDGAGGARPGDGEQDEEEDPDDVPSPMPRPYVDCAGVSCDPLSHVCCVGLNGAACIPEDELCEGAVLLCTANRDCAEGAVCCLQEIGISGAFASCGESCSSRGGWPRQLCQSDDECERGRCRPTRFGVSVCRGGS